jgi:hypothetical protein
MKTFNPFKKLMVGIVLFASFFLLYELTGGTNGLYDVQSGIEAFLGFLPKDIASILSNFGIILLGSLMVYCFISGLYRICTCNIYNPVFEDKVKGGIPVRGSDVYPNINRVLSFRESKLAGLSPNEGADLYVGSAKLESLYTGYQNGPETQRVLSYIESKLSGMSSDRGLNYLANKL